MIISSIVFILYSLGKIEHILRDFHQKRASLHEISLGFHGKSIQVFVCFFLQSKLYPRDDFPTAINCLL